VREKGGRGNISCRLAWPIFALPAFKTGPEAYKGNRSEGGERERKGGRGRGKDVPVAPSQTFNLPRRRYILKGDKRK